MTSKLDILTSTQGDVCIVRLEGMLDGHTAPSFDRRMAELYASHKRMVLHLCGLTYIASAGIGIMISYLQKLQHSGGCLHLASPTDTVREIFNLLGLHALLQIHEQLDKAIVAARA